MIWHVLARFENRKARIVMFSIFDVHREQRSMAPAWLSVSFIDARIESSECRLDMLSGLSLGDSSSSSNKTTRAKHLHCGLAALVVASVDVFSS